MKPYDWRWNRDTQTGIERDLGISQGIISRWKRELRESGDQTFPEKNRPKPDEVSCGV